MMGDGQPSDVPWHHMLAEFHIHTIMMFGVTFAVLFTTAFLVVFFVRNVPVKFLRPSLMQFRDNTGTDSKMGFGQRAVGSKASAIDFERGSERQTVLVIPDISGYTRFVSLSRFSFGHAQEIIAELLGALIDSVSPDLIPSKLEGDAVLFFGPTNAAGELKGRALGAAIFDLLESFYAKREALKQSNLCPCAACRAIDGLDLKVFVHAGPVLRFKFRDFHEISGLPVIEVHRLLKNSLDVGRYVMVTDVASAQVDLPIETSLRAHAEDYEGVGEMRASVYTFEIEDVLAGIEIDETIAEVSKTMDLKRKFARNVDMLRDLAGIGQRP